MRGLAGEVAVVVGVAAVAHLVGAMEAAGLLLEEEEDAVEERVAVGAEDNGGGDGGSRWSRRESMRCQRCFICMVDVLTPSGWQFGSGRGNGFGEQGERRR